MNQKLGGRTRIDPQPGTARMHSKAAVAMKIDRDQHRLNGRADDPGLQAPAALCGVAINDREGVAGLEIALQHPDPDDVDVPAQAAVQSRAMIFYERHIRPRLVFHPGAQTDSGARAMCGDVIARHRVRSLEPVRRVPDAGVPGVRQLHANAAVLADSALSGAVGYGPGSIVTRGAVAGAEGDGSLGRVHVRKGRGPVTRGWCAGRHHRRRHASGGSRSDSDELSARIFH